MNSKAPNTNSDNLEMMNRAQVAEAWDELNPLIDTGISPYPKSLLDIIDGFFRACVEVYPERFLVQYKDLGLLTRCRPGRYTNASDICAPPIDVAVDKQIVNRWNPPDKRYLYLAHTLDGSRRIDSYTENEFTCLEEVRAKTGSDYTFANFRPLNIKARKYIINMDYSDITQQHIEDLTDAFLKHQTLEAMNEIIPLLIQGVPLSKELIMKLAPDGTHKLAAGCVGDTLLRIICQTIFTPIDDNVSTSGQKTKAYGSFHVLAQFLEDKGICGVIYPSTRTKLRGEHTQNITIFLPDDFIPLPSSLRVITMK